MSEILSQSEIDKLLADLSGGDTSTLVVEEGPQLPVAKSYNFARPSKFHRDQLRTLEIIFENYSRLLSSFMTAYLRTNCEIEIASAEQITFKEFHNSIVNPIVLGIIDLNPLKGAVVLEMSSNVGYAIIDRVLGGPGLGIKKLREFSEIEKILLERIVAQMLEYLVEPWENVIVLEPRLEKIETSSQFAQIIAPNEMVVLVTLTIRVGVAEGFINFCIPHFVLEPILEKLNTKSWFTQVEHDVEDTFAEDLSTQVEKAKIAIRAILGSGTISVGEFVELQVGDVIALDQNPKGDIGIMVGEILKFKAKPGTSRGKNAIQITSVIRKEE
ncbi:MAG: flagellar motor switch protein FliM [Defluviitaleaceae bacterium]|nr:flagellar motor switch protein FliM [Defluviitaleaceae bacterium]